MVRSQIQPPNAKATTVKYYAMQTLAPRAPAPEPEPEPIGRAMNGEEIQPIQGVAAPQTQPETQYVPLTEAPSRPMFAALMAILVLQFIQFGGMAYLTLKWGLLTP